ncbi:hypothetical protein [Oligosphaera ethanolica]|uniref:Uncharacterized protein n=1 Tax=Oligosphaera ethanolica TaxID=760260 RepID=A0AAE3VI69_9BACT|nr:hypothetical protein [Oligosphaera ethanolica]MDQ0291002.1 hypothetical protein [Oligosphaera ethanolica]
MNSKINNNNAKIRLMKREAGGTRCITAVRRSVSDAHVWAKEKNRKLDFYGPLCWIVEK